MASIAMFSHLHRLHAIEHHPCRFRISRRISEFKSDTANCFNPVSHSLALHLITANEPPQLVPVTLLLILVAVTHQRHPPLSCKLSYQAQRKLLAMVLNDSAAPIERPIKELFISILL
jgi:hypothetical protein